MEVDHCRKQQPFQIQVGPVRRDSLADAMEQAEEEAAAAARGITLGNYQLFLFSVPSTNVFSILSVNFGI